MLKYLCEKGKYLFVTFTAYKFISKVFATELLATQKKKKDRRKFSPRTRLKQEKLVTSELL